MIPISDVNTPKIRNFETKQNEHLILVHTCVHNCMYILRNNKSFGRISNLKTLFILAKKLFIQNFFLLSDSSNSVEFMLLFVYLIVGTPTLK